MNSIQVQQEPQNEMITVQQAHEAIGSTVVSTGSMYNAIRRGQIPSVRLGGRILIPRRAFMSWLSGNHGIEGTGVS